MNYHHKFHHSASRVGHDLIVRPITEDDIPALISLYHLCFQHRPSARFIRWRYFETRAGATPMLAAFDEDVCVASGMAWPQRVMLNGKVMKAAQGCDIMVHPEYRGRGLFAKLGKLLVGQIESERYQLIFVFPSDESLHIGVRYIKWRKVCDVPRWTRPLWLLGTSRLSGIAVAASLQWSPKTAKDIRIELQAPRPEIVAQLAAACAEPHDGFAMQRNRTWFAWRYHVNSDKNYRWVAAYAGAELRGVAVWRFDAGTRRANLCELIGDGHSIPAVLNAVLRGAYHRRARGLDFPTNDPALVPHLKASGFIRRPGFRFAVRSLDDRIPTERLHMPEAWKIYGGDFDYY